MAKTAPQGRQFQGFSNKALSVPQRPQKEQRQWPGSTPIEVTMNGTCWSRFGIS